MSTTVPASLVKQLRDETGAGMMDCKRALTETGGDLEAARKLLREQGMAHAIKRQVRETTEGKVGYRVTETRGTMVAVGCETEPVSNNEEFLAFAKRVLDAVEEYGPEAIDSLDEERTALVAKLHENIVIRGAARYDAGEGERIAAYAHPPANKIGVLVKVRGGDDQLARRLAMHISFAAPRWVTRDEVTADYVDSEREVYEKLPEVASKPEEHRAKIIEGMLAKRFYAASPGGVLAEQPWIHDTTKTVRQALEDAGMEVVEFVRFSVSE
jgi:elongation factor Ts